MKHLDVKSRSVQALIPLLATIAGCFCLFVTGNFAVAAEVETTQELKAGLSVKRITIAKSSQSGSDYLDALADEAESTATVPSESGNKKAFAGEMAKMAGLIKEKKPSLYQYYEKLNSGNKTRIYELYVADSSSADDRLKHLRKQVMDLYFDQ